MRFLHSIIAFLVVIGMVMAIFSAAVIFELTASPSVDGRPETEPHETDSYYQSDVTTEDIFPGHDETSGGENSESYTDEITTDPYTSEHFYYEFEENEINLWQYYVGTVIPFIPNDEYYIDGYYEETDFENGINFYTIGNTEAEFQNYLDAFVREGYSLIDSYYDDYGDMWYTYVRDDVTVDISYYYYDGVYFVDVFVFSSSISGSTPPVIDDEIEGLLTNNGKGLPYDYDGIYDVNFNDAAYVKNVTEQGYYLDGCPTTKSPAVLVIPVDFSDEPASLKEYDIESIRDVFTGYNDYYSVHDYYYISSYGQLDLEITVIDEWFRPQYDSYYYATATMDYMGDEVEIGDQLILDEALAHYSEYMDLSDFDSDGNGTIDSVVIVNTLDIDDSELFYWAYRYWNIYTDSDDYYYEYDGVSANDYMWIPYGFIYESYDENGNPSYTDTSVRNPFTFIHEFGHVLGADDYYDTAYVYDPLDECDIMSGMTGDHNPFTKFNYGWITSSELVVTSDSVTVELEAFSKNGDTVIIANNWDPTLGAYQEYYVIMYYTQSSLNSGVGGYFARDGIVVYHVNSSLYSETIDGETYYDIYNNNTHESAEDGTANNLIEFVKSNQDTFTYVSGDYLPEVYDDAGNRLCFTFAVDSIDGDIATLTFTRTY